MENCKICNKEFEKLKGLSTHFNNSHNLKNREYYDLFLLKENEGFCIICNRKTNFRNIGVGYLKHCSMECRDKNKNIKRDFWTGKKQSEETINKRIKNTDQIKKENNRKKTMLTKYGVEIPSKIPEIKIKLSSYAKNRKFPRNDEWQKKIILSKIKNNTLKHNTETKKKISDSLNKHHKNNLDRDKYLKNKSKNHLSGWYNNVFFRSSLELSFLINNSSKNFESCENKKYAVRYIIDDKTKIYYPDYTDGNLIFEIKPLSLINHNNNEIKIKFAKEKYGNKFILITEVESPYVSKDLIKKLIMKGDIVLTNNNSDVIFKRYKY
jgi:hypothetical protein